MRLAIQQLSLHAGTHTLVEALDFTLDPGEILGILGANGAGKSTLLAVLAGLAQPSQGQVTLDGQAVTDLPLLTRAQHIALLPQADDGGFFGSVADFVALGHYPFDSSPNGHGALPSPTKKSAMPASLSPALSHKRARGTQNRFAMFHPDLAPHLATWELTDLADRPLAMLSGGERQRARLAQLAMQQARIALLDEPLTHLDPAHQARLLLWARAEAHAGKSVVLTLHDPNWAACHCDRLLFLHGDGRWQLGTPAELLTPDSLEALYGPGTAPLWRQGR